MNHSGGGNWAEYVSICFVLLLERVLRRKIRDRRDCDEVCFSEIWGLIEMLVNT